MRQGELEDLVKNWQKMLDNCHEMMKPVGAISNSIAKNIEGIMLGVERQTESIRMFWLENERSFKRAMDSMRSISDAIGEAHKSFRVPEMMAENIRKVAEGLTQQMKPMVKFLREWQDLTKNW